MNEEAIHGSLRIGFGVVALECGKYNYESTIDYS